MMGLFSSTETLEITFEQYAEDSRMDLRNWSSWIGFAIDIGLITAAVSSGGLPFAVAPLVYSFGDHDLVGNKLIFICHSA